MGVRVNMKHTKNVSAKMLQALHQVVHMGVRHEEVGREVRLLQVDDLVVAHEDDLVPVQLPV